MNRNLMIGVAAVGALAVAYYFFAGPPQEAPTGPKLALTVVDPAIAASVSGRVRYEGKVPEPARIDMSSSECGSLHHGAAVPDGKLLVKDGLLRNAVVYVKFGLEGKAFAVSAEPVTVDQKGCLFVPRIVAVQAGQPIRFLNSDPTKHNVKGLPKAKGSDSFNLSFAFKGISHTATLSEPEIAVPLNCDYHPWMLGYVAVLDHPFFQVTGPDGAFSLKGLPPGDYEIEAWHETSGRRAQKVHLDPSGTQEIILTFGTP
jgi:plastocyanin